MGIGPRVRFAAAVVLVAAGCNNPEPRNTGLTLPTGVGGGNGTLSGTVTSFTNGAPVGGVTVRLGSITANSDAGGKFTLPGTPVNGAAVVTASVPGFVFRGVSFTLAASRGDLALDLLPDGAPFSLNFYRQLVRNGANSASLEPIRRWTVNPSFYFRQRTVDNNALVPVDVIQSIQDTFTNAVPALTGGKFTVGTFEVGDTERAPLDGWVNVNFYTTSTGLLFNCGSDRALGCASVGGNQGTMTIRHDPAGVPLTGPSNPYNCSSVARAVADHEITHSMGYWHTEDALVDTFSGNGCSGVTYPDFTRFHASVAYSRPVGNLDPDIDTTASAHLTASGSGSRRTVVCDLTTFRRR
jgi:hypothetical protein